jgi:hypothetical protein
VYTSSRLRVGIMLDSLAGSAWIGKIIQDIRTSDFAELSLVILNLDKPKPKPPIWRRLLTFDVSPQAKRGALFYFYSLLDERLFPNRVDAFQTVDLGELCSGVETLRVMPEKKKFTDRFTKTDIDAIRAKSYRLRGMASGPFIMGTTWLIAARRRCSGRCGSRILCRAWCCKYLPRSWMGAELSIDLWPQPTSHL